MRTASRNIFPENVRTERITTLPDRQKQMILNYMWNRYRTAINKGTDGRDTDYHIICHDTSLYGSLQRAGLTVFHGYVTFDLHIDGEHITRAFYRLDDAWLALRILYNLFEGLPLEEGLR